MQSMIDPPDWVHMYERLILRTEDALAGYDAPYAKSNIAEIRFLETELGSFYQRLAVWRHRCAQPIARSSAKTEMSPGRRRAARATCLNETAPTSHSSWVTIRLGANEASSGSSSR